MPVKVTRYKCDYCKKTYTRSYSAYQHGLGCYYNPKNRTCRTCKYNEEQSYTVYNRHHGGDPGSTDFGLKVMICANGDYVGSEDPNEFDCELWEAKG